jgi:hypothetical protein
MWGGWGSNPRPADYEKYGHVRRTHYLHGYDRVMPLMAPIALVAPMARSTSRSTGAAPDPFVLLLYVTLRPVCPVRQEPEAQPNAIPNITNRGVSARPRRPDGRAGGAAS